MVQVDFLGTGDAFAVGLRTNVSLLLRDDDIAVQIECGPTTLHQLHRVGMTADQITHLFVSHRHGDHILGLPMFLLMRSTGETKSPLDILGNADVIQTGRQLMELVYTELCDRLKTVRWTALPGDRKHSQALTSSVQISTLPVPHSEKTPSLGMRLDFEKSGRSVVFTGDTTHTEKLAEFAADCDLLVHEANFSKVLHPDIDAARYGHSTAHEAGRTAASANCRILALVHMNGDCVENQEQVRGEAAQGFEGQIIIPNDGATLFL